MQQKTRLTKVGWVVASLVILSGLFDVITFLILKEYRAFEINPLYILTGSIVFILIYKFIVLGIIAYVLYYARNYKKDHWRFLMITVSVYLIFAQILGGISNLYTASQKPDISQAMQPNEAIQTYNIFAILIIYLPILFTMLCFKLWQWSYKIKTTMED